MSASDTPRTNGMEVDAEDVFRFGSPDSKWVESNKVRQLERELNQLKAYEAQRDKDVDTILDERDQLITERDKLKAAIQYDGSWMDKYGTCKVCGGEIPHGHTNNCDVYKLEQWRKVADDLAEVVSNEMLEEYGYRRPCLQLDAYNKLKATHDPQP